MALTLPNIALDRQTALQALAGAVLLGPPLARLLSFTWFYFLRPSSLKKYLHGSKPYVLVTGATDGIGKAVAAEYYAKGFNLILHARNETKMRAVIAEIKAQRVPERDIQYFIADAGVQGQDFAKMVEPFKVLDITIVFNNVGGETNPERIDKIPEDALFGSIYRNNVFGLFLTRALLPRLRATAAHGPVLVQFVGSIAADAGPITLAIYGANKAFLRTLARGLDNDEHVLGPKSSGVRFAYLHTSVVQSNSLPMPTNVVRPTAARFAKSVVSLTGCGYRDYVPYWAHAIQIAAMRYVDSWSPALIDRIGAHQMRNVIELLKRMN